MGGGILNWWDLASHIFVGPLQKTGEASPFGKAPNLNEATFKATRMGLGSWGPLRKFNRKRSWKVTVPSQYHFLGANC